MSKQKGGGRSGQPVSSRASAEKRLKDAVEVIFFIVFVNILVGVGAEVFRVDLFITLGGSWITVVFGVIFLLLAFWVRQRSAIGLAITIVIFGIDTLLWIPVIVTGGVGPTVFGAGFMRLFIFFSMFRGFGAIHELNNPDLLDEDDPFEGAIASKLKGLPPLSEPTPKRKNSSQSRWTRLMPFGATAVLAVLFIGGVFLLTYTQFASRQSPAQSIVATPTIPLVVGPIELVNALTSPITGDATLALNLTPQTPASPDNIFDKPAASPAVAGDLAWNKPTFANGYYANGYPSGPTSGWMSIPWRSRTSTGSWYYVDLGTPQTIHQILLIQSVDSAFTNSPVNDYIVSDDLITWQVIARERNTANSLARWKTRVVTLDEDVTARYVGLYAREWRGGWGGINLFSVLGAEHSYAPESLPMANAAP